MYEKFETEMWRHYCTQLDEQQQIQLYGRLENKIWLQLMNQLDNKLRNRLYYGWVETYFLWNW
jgi:hypothetical protein